MKERKNERARAMMCEKRKTGEKDGKDYYTRSTQSKPGLTINEMSPHF